MAAPLAQAEPQCLTGRAGKSEGDVPSAKRKRRKKSVTDIESERRETEDEVGRTFIVGTSEQNWDRVPKNLIVQNSWPWAKISSL